MAIGVGVKILIAAGGTGGHVFPAISLANKIKELDASAEIAFCVDKRIGGNLLDKFGYKYFLLNAPQMPYGISLKWISFLIRLMFSLFKSSEILFKANPDIVVGFGAYVSGPLLRTAKRKNKKIIIHEQNVTMGRANQILSKISDKIALGFKNDKYMKDPRSVLTGNPIRVELLEDLNALNREGANHLLGLDPKKKTILIMGGSQGSHIINIAFLETLRNLPEDLIDSIQIIHLTGKDEFVNVQSAYRNIKVKAIVHPFFERMGLLYKTSDLVICRAGAIAVSELCIFALPTILIPYSGAGGHQMQNAIFLEKRGAAIVLQEKHLRSLALKNAFVSLLLSGETRVAMSKNARLCTSADAAEKLAEAVLKL